MWSVRPHRLWFYLNASVPEEGSIVPRSLLLPVIRALDYIPQFILSGTSNIYSASLRSHKYPISLSADAETLISWCSLESQCPCSNRPPSYLGRHTVQFKPPLSSLLSDEVVGKGANSPSDGVEKSRRRRWQGLWNRAAPGIRLSSNECKCGKRFSELIKACW